MESIVHRFGGALFLSWFGLVLEVEKGTLDGSEGWWLAVWCQSVSKDGYGGSRGQVIGRLSGGNIYVHR